MRSKLILAAGGILAVLALYFFGKTTEKKDIPGTISKPEVPAFNVSSFLQSQKEKLPLTVRLLADSLEASSQQGTDNDKVLVFNRLAELWKDSAGNAEMYCYYTSEAAKLVNSEKNLTFAAQLSVDLLRSQKDESRVDWLSSQSIDLFERAIRLNPENDDLKVGLGSAYIFGKGRTGHPEETMKGIQQLLSVARKDSNNMKAQLMLGIGGFISGQYEKAAARLEKVVSREPDNLEAAAFLADTYAAMGKKEEAVRWYTVSKRLANNPEYAKEADERIEALNKGGNE
jgi:cytochrome c-type biogenesis protein CcmH/NrfG